MSGTPVSRVVNYRIRSDTGTVDASPTFVAAENTAGSVTVGTAFRIRMTVENTGTGSDTIATPNTTVGIKRCGYGPGFYTSLVDVFNGADASTSADGTAVTVQRLSSATGSFANGSYDEDESIAQAIANGNFTEVEFGVVLTGGASTIGVGGGETWTFEPSGLTNASLNVPTFTTPNTNGTNIQHGNQLGGASQLVANSASISFTTAAGASSGNLVVVCVSCDNNGTTDADHSEISSVTIDGNAATKAIEFTNGQGSAQAGCTSSIWYRQLTGAMSAGATITANFANATTSGDANVIQAREFAVTSGYTIAVEATGTGAADGATQPASTDATTSNIECLRICCHGCEDGINQTTSASNFVNLTRASNNTWSLWWTDAFLARSTGLAATDISNIVESTISTGTGAASRIGSIGISTDWASAYVAFRADPPAGGGQPVVKRAGGVEFMHNLGMGKHIKVWFQSLIDWMWNGRSYRAA